MLRKAAEILTVLAPMGTAPHANRRFEANAEPWTAGDRTKFLPANGGILHN